MLKDTNSLGNNKAPACESRGFVHKKGDVHFEVPPESWTLNYNFINSLHNELGIVPGSFHLASF